ncbi:phage major capsid protein, partial [Streptomyces candidus]
MAYNNITTRTDTQALIPEDISNEMLGKATEQSAVLQLFRRVPVSAGQVRFPVLSALPMAYWVTGDTGLKQTTEVNWTNK